VEPCQSVEGLVKPSLIDGVVYYDPSSKLKVSNGALIKVDSEKKTVIVNATRFSIKDGRVVIDGRTLKSENGVYKLSGEGSYMINISGFDPGYEQVSQTVDILPYTATDVVQVELTPVQKAARDAARALTQGMSQDMLNVSKNIDKYKTVTDASKANLILDEQTRTTFKKSMGSILQPLIGSDQLPTGIAKKAFEDVSIGFGAVK
jgi:hypothetical protein